MKKKKEKTEEQLLLERVFARQSTIQANMRTIDTWGLSHVLVPILMQPDNTIKVLRRLLTIAEYEHDLLDMDDHVVSIQKDLTVKFKIDWERLILYIYFEKKIGERICLEYNAVDISTTFKEDFKKILHLHL